MLQNLTISEHLEERKKQNQKSERCTLICLQHCIESQEPFSFWAKTNAIITPLIPHSIDRAFNNMRFEIRSDLDDVLQFLMHGGAEPLQALLTSGNLH